MKFSGAHILEEIAVIIPMPSPLIIKGFVYIARATTSLGGFPTTLGAFNQTFQGGSPDGTDALIAKFNQNGSALLYRHFSWRIG